MFLLFPLEVVQALLLSSLFSFDKFELLILGILKRFVKLGHLSLLVILFSLLFKSFFCGGYGISLKFFRVLAAFIILSIKSTHEIAWSRVTWWNRTEGFSEKSNVFGTKWQMFFCNLLAFNSRAYIILIPEHILWLNICLTLIWVGRAGVILMP